VALDSCRFEGWMNGAYSELRSGTRTRVALPFAIVRRTVVHRKQRYGNIWTIRIIAWRSADVVAREWQRTAVNTEAKYLAAEGMLLKRWAACAWLRRIAERAARAAISCASALGKKASSEHMITASGAATAYGLFQHY